MRVLPHQADLDMMSSQPLPLTHNAAQTRKISSRRGMAGNLTSKKSVSLSLTSQYAPSWKTWEGIRELVQNWHDGVFSSLEKMELDCRTEMLPRTSVAFLSCKQGDSLVYKAVLTTAGNSFLYEGMTELNSSSDNFESVNGEFDRSFESTRDQQQRNVVLGKIVYSPFRKKLILVNYNTELMRKVLLLGFSKKASSKEVIGQFGEGLKVGALALVREGRFVSMETSRDRWKFGLSCDDTFNEEVLTVFVKDRSQEIDDDNDDDNGDDDLGQQDTCVTVRPLCLEDWKVYLERFLFLCPPSDCVKSEIGTLLIGDRYKGQLYVKGVWVSDLSKDGLSSGVDFAHLKIDRDRRAVMHLSDIDHQVSSMWVHAIEQRPDLIPLYYSLLEENNTSDVRHANFYLTDKSAFLVAQQFFAIHGSMTYPVSNSISTELLDEIKREIHQKLVLCNEALINILYKSGAVEPVESILSRASMKKSVIVPYADLTQNEVSILKHIEKLVQICIPEFKMGSMDISDASGNAIVLTDSNHFEIPRGLLREKIEHYGGENCRRGDSCLCREALIAAKILTLQPNSNGELIQGKISAS